MSRELNYTSMRLEDFDYRRNLNDRFLTDILDAKKVVLYDDLKIFKKVGSEQDNSGSLDDTGLEDTTRISVVSDDEVTIKCRTQSAT